MKIQHKAKIILTGYSIELLLLCEQNDFTIMGIVEPKKPLSGLPCPVFNNDDEALRALKPDFVINGIDAIDRKVKVDEFYSNRGVSPANLVCGAHESSCLRI